MRLKNDSSGFSKGGNSLRPMSLASSSNQHFVIMEEDDGRSGNLEMELDKHDLAF